MKDFDLIKAREAFLNYLKWRREYGGWCNLQGEYILYLNIITNVYISQNLYMLQEFIFEGV